MPHRCLFIKLSFILILFLPVLAAAQIPSRLPKGSDLPPHLVERLVVQCTALTGAYNAQEERIILLEGRLALATGQIQLLKDIISLREEQIAYKSEQIALLKRKRNSIWKRIKRAIKAE